MISDTDIYINFIYGSSQAIKLTQTARARLQLQLSSDANSGDQQRLEVTHPDPVLSLLGHQWLFLFLLVQFQLHQHKHTFRLLTLPPNLLPGAANCTFDVSYPGPWARSTGRQKQSPEPLPPESPIYCGTEIEEGRLSMENVARIESKRVKALSAHFIDSQFNEEINR